MDCIVPDDDWVNTSYTSRSPSFGHFGVSETSWPEHDEQLAPYCDSNTLAYMMEQQAQGQVQQHPETTMNTPLPEYSPTFSAGDSNTFQQPDAILNARPSGSAQSASHLPDVYNRSRNTGRGKSRVIKDTRRRIRPNAKKSGEPSTPQRASNEPCQYEFKEGTPEEIRFVIEEYERRKCDKGGTMWTDIRNAFAEKFGRKPSKSNLQMMRSRGLKQYVLLSDFDKELMPKVFYDYENGRYPAMVRILHEQGGSPGINPTMLEYHMVVMGYERFDMDPKTKVRPRMKVPRGGRSTAKRAVHMIQCRANPPLLTEEEQEALCIQVEGREISADGCSPIGMMKDEGDLGVKDNDRRDPNNFQQLGGLKREYDDI
ncbi:uncharacterized protein DNG_04784 [Cephalotrichum gorgonifer]|uniref:Uncharacterized protein n=1 Tax=Cephalotrichum gorgonifer TaxID=2041049 RepID=A0AAE8MWQ5_9PEZI|nr:uncharacterized protein DNG_04784 [Cephalotrichum gorgonifer]